MKNTIDLHNAAVLVTGAAGFIGSNLAKQLLDSIEGIHVIGFDNVNDYYDVRLKEYRLNQLSHYEGFTFIKADLADKDAVNDVFEQYRPTVVVNLAAQAGVRYSITHPDAYIQSNLIGFYNILEACRHHPVDHLVYASSSSVYGSNKKVPYSTDDKVDNPVSLYAATKKSDEDALIWRILVSPISFVQEKQSRFSTMAIADVTLPMLMTLLRASCA